MEASENFHGAKGPKNFASIKAPGEPEEKTRSVPEERLAGALGLTRARLLDWRQTKGMSEGIHFATVKKEIHFLWPGLQQVAELAGLPSDAFAWLLEEGKAEPVLLIAHRTCQNSRILLCHKPGEDPFSDGTQRVQVRSNANFVPGMAVPALHEEGDLYRLDHACPRWRGRW